MLKIKYNYSIEHISYIKVGGKIKVYIETDDIEVVKKVLKVTKKIKYIGNTSNIFFCFKYCDYILLKYINTEIIIDELITLGSSLPLNYVSKKLMNLSIEGFEKLSGIPGFIGGSIVNNSSCYNQCISDNLHSLVILDETRNLLEIKKSDIVFSHHYSSLRNKNVLIICARFEKKYLPFEELNKKYQYAKENRINNQPYNKLTLGSTFKKYQNIVVPRIIEEMNLKGMKKGDTSISLKHSNFIEIGHKENFRNIISLIEEVNQLLYNKLGYYIELEIECIKR